MPVDDLWFRTRRGVDGERVKTARHGRGKRWRCRYVDASGVQREKLFDRKVDAEEWDAKARAGVVEEARSDGGRLTFRDYGERWRLAREVGVAEETRRRVEGNLRLHLYPTFGGRVVRFIRPTEVLEWLTGMVRAGTPKNSIRLYFDLLRSVLNAARADRVIVDNPTDGVDLTQFLRGMSRAPKWVPTAAQVVGLLDVVPQRYRAMVWVGAGQALRISEVLGVELGARCVDFRQREFRVVQQLRHAPEHGGFYLCDPKSGSSGTLDLDTDVSTALQDHISEFPPVAVDLVDITGGGRCTRRVLLLFTDDKGRPISDQRWSEMWAGWRREAGWPGDAGFHALRHFCATTMITAGVEPQAVQHHLRHASLKITLETYVGWWPRAGRSQGLIGGALRAVNESRSDPDCAVDVPSDLDREKTAGQGG